MELNPIDKLAIEQIDKRICEMEKRSEYCATFDKDAAARWKKQAYYLRNLRSAIIDG